MQTKRALSLVRQHCGRVTASRAGRYKARVGDKALYIHDRDGVAEVTTQQEGRKPIRHRSITDGLRTVLHQGILVFPAGTSDMLIAVGIQRTGPSLVSEVYVMAILLRDRRACKHIPGAQLTSAKAEHLEYVESLLAGGVDDAALLGWLSGLDEQLARVIALARQ